MPMADGVGPSAGAPTKQIGAAKLVEQVRPGEGHLGAPGGGQVRIAVQRRASGVRPRVLMLTRQRHPHSASTSTDDPGRGALAACRHRSHHPPEAAQVHPEPAPVQRQRGLTDRAAGDVGHRARSIALRGGRDTAASRPPAAASASSASGFAASGRAVARRQAAAVDRDPARGQRLLQHRPGDGRGREPAVVLAARVVDLHDHDELRMIRRERWPRTRRCTAPCT